MAATVGKTYTIQGTPFPKTRVDLSALTADEPEDIAHVGPSGVKVREVRMEIVTRPDDGSDIRLWHDENNDSLTNDTCRLRFYTAGGGSLTGAEVYVHFEFGAMKSGGTSAPSPGV